MRRQWLCAWFCYRCTVFWNPSWVINIPKFLRLPQLLCFSDNLFLLHHSLHKILDSSHVQMAGNEYDPLDIRIKMGYKGCFPQCYNTRRTIPESIFGYCPCIGRTCIAWDNCPWKTWNEIDVENLPDFLLWTKCFLHHLQHAAPNDKQGITLISLNLKDLEEWASSQPKDLCCLWN